MALFPKKLALGGGIQNTGIGVTYVNQIADAPDVSAAELLLETNRKNEQYLEEERLKKKPNRAAIITDISKREGIAGEKADFQNQIISSLDEYDRASRKDPNWVFSQEGVDHFSNLMNDSIDPARTQQMSNNFKTLASGYDTVIKSGGLDAAQISNGKVTVLDKDGVTKEVPLDQIDRETQQVMTSKQRFDQVSNKSGYNPAVDRFYSGLSSLDNAKKTLFSGFDDAVGAYQGQQNGSVNGIPVIMDVMNNASSLRAAKQQALASMSDETRSSLQSDYLQKLNGSKYTQAGFDKFVNGILDQEVTKRKKSSSSLSSEGIRLMAEMRKAAEDDTTVADPSPTYYTTGRALTVKDTQSGFFGGDADVDVLVHGDSAIPIDPAEKTIPKLAINGDVWAIGGKGRNSDDLNFSANNSDDEYGASKKISRTLENVQHESNSIVPVTVGPVYNESGIATGESIKSGRIIMQGPSNKYAYGKGDRKAFLQGTQPQSMTVYEMGADGNSHPREISVIQREDGRFVEVKNTAVKVFKGVDDGKDFTILQPMNRRESLFSLGVNLSSENRKINFFTDGNKFPSDSNSQGQVLLSKLALLNKALYTQISKQINSEYASGKSNALVHDNINDVLSWVKDRIEDQSVTNTFRYAKEEGFTKNKPSQYVR